MPNLCSLLSGGVCPALPLFKCAQSIPEGALPVLDLRQPPLQCLTLGLVLPNAGARFATFCL